MFARIAAAAVSVPMILSSLAGVAAAQEAPAAAISQQQAAPERRDSINFSPLGVLWGSYSVNYEHLFEGGHGLLVEGTYSSYANDEADSASYGGALGYRYHLNGTQDSWFLGATASYDRGNGWAEVNGERFDLDVTSKGLTGNVGRRWQMAGGINVTFRVGAGWGEHTVDAESDSEDAQDAEDVMNGLLELVPFAVEGEISVGYTF